MAIVVPSKDTSVTTYLVDDQFGNLITYSDGWQPLGVIEEFGGTTHGASTAGMTATFAFSGTEVHVFGTVGETQSDPNPTRGPPQSSYSIDGGPVTQYTAPSTNISLRSVHFFESPILSNGQHVLTITYNGGREYYLDYIQYIGPIQASTTGTASTPTFASTKSSTSTSTTTTGATTLPAVSGNTSTNTPVLAGAVVGAFFGGVIVALLCFFCWSYSKRKKQPRQISNAPLNLNDPDTFTTASFHPSALYRDAAGSQPASVFTQPPPTGPTPSLTPSSNGGSSTRGLYTRSTTPDSWHIIPSGSNPPAYSKRREAFGS